MTEQKFWHSILAINMANFMVNMENLAVNREILAMAKERDASTASLLQSILDELREGKDAGN